jgi:hypothetical protein
MDGFFTGPVKSLGPEPRLHKGSFAANGTSSPSTANNLSPTGFAFVATRSATGTFSVAVPAGCGCPAQPHTITVHPNPTTASDWFEACVVGDSTLNATGRAFTILCHRGGTALDPTGRVGFTIHFDASTGK